MFKEVHTLEDLKYVHFVVLIFRDADQCRKYYIDFKEMNLTPNKQYWALITDVDKADNIHTYKDGFYVSFKGDDNFCIRLWIPCNLCENGLTAYTFRTPDEEIALMRYKASKIADILERTVLKYDEHPRRSEDERFQTNLERNVDEKYIKELCQEEGLYDPDNHDMLDIDWIHWKPGHEYRVHYNEHGNGNGISFDVNIGGQILGQSDLENICTLPLEIKRYRDELRKFTETHPDELPEDGFPIIPYTDTKIGPHAFICPSDWLGKVTKITWKSDGDYHGIDKATVKCFPNQYINFLKDASMLKNMKLIPVMMGSITGDKTKEFNVQRLIGFMLSE